MGTKTFFFLLISGAILFSWRAVADEVSGRTADGCTYKVINGQYLTSCPSRGAAPAPSPQAAAPRAADQVRTVTSAPVTDYDSVPMRSNAAAPAPSLQPQARYQAMNAPVSAIEKDNAPVASEERASDSERPRILDQVYLGLNLGASNMVQANAGSAFGFGAVLGSDLDDIFGIELGYSYSSQSLNLGLINQGASTDPTQNGGITGGFTGSTTDSTLTSNLFTAEVKANLTDPSKRLRPYLGTGLGWRSATLTENVDPLNNLAGGSLHQNALVGIGSLGTTLRIAKQFSLAFAFNYFLPLIRPGATLNQPLGGGTTALTSDDDLFTGSNQYQVLGGVQYSF